MEDQTAILPGALQADPFETVMRGYNRRQVNDYMSRTTDQIHDLETRLGQALDALAQTRGELVQARDQAAASQEQAANRPAHEEVSERLSQILRLAAEEAEQERAKADNQIALMRQSAQAEVEQLLETAHAEADRTLASAREESERELAHARDEAQQVVSAARAEAEHTVTEAKEHAERLRRQAERRAAVVNGDLTQRVEALTAAHSAAVGRLSEMNRTLADLLRVESDAGALAALLAAIDTEPAPPADDELALVGDTEPGPSAGSESTPVADAVAAEVLGVRDAEAPATAVDVASASTSAL